MRFFTTIGIILLIVACSTPETADTSEHVEVLPTANPLDYGLDQEEMSAIESHIQWAIDSFYISGAVALIAKNDKIIYHKAFGYSDRAKTKSMSTDNIFRMASMTKPITSTAVMQLVEQGEISLDDPVKKYIPEFANTEVIDTWDGSDSSFTSVPVERDITIHHLLTHTSGIAYSVFHPTAGIVYPQFGFVEAWTKDSITLAGNIPKLGSAPLMHQPGVKWTYGTNIDVLGYVVELVSGMSLDEYLSQNLFQPLGMADSYFYLPDGKANRLVDVWLTPEIDEETMVGFLTTDYPIAGAETYFPGGAGLVSTSTDYLRFACALLNGGTLGTAKILEPTTVDMMFQNQIDTLREVPGEGFGYGGMVRVEEDADGRNVGYWGWDGFWQTRFRIDPENDMVLILMTNAYGTPKWDELLGGYGKLVVQAIED